MSILGFIASLVGKSIGIGSGSSIVQSITDVIGAVYKTEGEKLQRQELLDRINCELQTKEIELSQSFISTKNPFMAGWWGLLGWSCSLTLVYAFLIRPIINDIFHLDLSPMDFENAQNMIYTLLGMGTLKASKSIVDVITNAILNKGKNK